MTLPSQEYLQSRIDYNPETGEARWKAVDESYGPRWKHFNSIWAGQLLNDRVTILNKKYSTAKIIYKMLHNEDLARTAFANRNPKDLTSKNLLKTIVCPTKASKTLKTAPISLDVCKLVCLDPKSGILTWEHNGKLATRNSQGYQAIHFNINGHSRSIMSHRVSWYLYYGTDPVGYIIDHIDGNRSNNCILNLRLANQSFNRQQATSRKPYKTTTGKWEIAICINKKQLHLGTFDTELEAKTAYESAVRQYKPIYKFTQEEQAQLDQLYNSYPNCDPNLQKLCHEIQVKALKFYVDAAIVQTPNSNVNKLLQCSIN